jgi:hypothetical protein
LLDFLWLFHEKIAVKGTPGIFGPIMRKNFKILATISGRAQRALASKEKTEPILVLPSCIA